MAGRLRVKCGYSKEVVMIKSGCGWLCECNGSMVAVVTG